MRGLASLIRRGRRCDSGAELIEFALTMPILLLVVLGIIEFGFMFREYEVITNAAREGARIVVLPAYQKADAKTRVEQYITAAGLNVARATVPLATGPTSVALGGGKCVSTFTQTVSYSHPVPFVGGIVTYFGGTFGAATLNASSTMRSETAAVGC